LSSTANPPHNRIGGGAPRHLESASMLLVQLSDPHVRPPGKMVNGRVDTNAMLAQAVRAVRALAQAPDAVLVTGDLTDFASADEYAHLRDLLAPLACPVYLMAGNHDDRDTLRAAFPGHAYLHAADSGPFVQYAIDFGGRRLIALDSVVPREPHGELCEARLAWLEQALAAAPGVPTVIAVHHPPFATGIGHMDEMGLRVGAAAFERIVAAYPNVERVLCGHLHRSIQKRWAGTIAMTAPSTAHQLDLNLSPNAAGAYTLEPPGFLVHAWSEALGLVTHLAFSGPWDGPYSFRDGSLVARVPRA
jgi:3',5'-cyclic AMP phosphodiesterase CpdA